MYTKNQIVFEKYRRVSLQVLKRKLLSSVEIERYP